MRARAPVLALAAAALLAVGSAASGANPSRAASPGGEATLRVVSMNPSLTSILIALDAAGALVGIEEVAAVLHPELAALPRVGGLFNPSVEAVVALQPDLVVLVPSAQQRDFVRRLEALGVEVLVLPNITVEEILASIEVLGARVGRAEAARARVAEIRAAFDEVRRRTGTRPPVDTLVVLQRDPLYVVGHGSFVDEMLAAAGGHNAAGGFGEPYPRVAMEWAIEAAPEVILDVSDAPPAAAVFWRRWPSIPAVASGRALSLDGERITYPGPNLDRAVRLLARTLHGEGVLAE